MWQNFVQDYLTFSRRDRLAILLILVVIIIVFWLPDIIKPSKNNPANTDTAWMTALERMEKNAPDSFQKKFNSYEHDNATAYQYDRPAGKYTTYSKGELFYFDPNTLSAEGWQRLGIREKTIQTIQHYLSKGGKFRKPEDLQRIYGLFPNEYERIASYIKIDGDGRNTGYTNNQYAEKPSTYNNIPEKPATPRYSIIDINKADTAAFIALPGIGSKLAFRIVNFRDKLGGFYSIAQVGETFGLPDSTFQRIKQYLSANGMAVKKININTATVDELKTHPYIKWALANPIIAYRKEHGNYSNVEDIKNIMAVTDEVYNKIVAYLSVN